MVFFESYCTIQFHMTLLMQRCSVYHVAKDAKAYIEAWKLVNKAFSNRNLHGKRSQNLSTEAAKVLTWMNRQCYRFGFLEQLEILYVRLCTFVTDNCICGQCCHERFSTQMRCSLNRNQWHILVADLVGSVNTKNRAISVGSADPKAIDYLEDSITSRLLFKINRFCFTAPSFALFVSIKT